MNVTKLQSTIPNYAFVQKVTNNISKSKIQIIFLPLIKKNNVKDALKVL